MLIDIVQDPFKFKWAGVPFLERYSESMKADSSLVKSIQKRDELLDLKFYMKTQMWHLVRYYEGKNNRHTFTRVWELDDKPELGLRKEPGFWIIEALQAADMWNRAENRIEEIDHHNLEVEKKNQEKSELIIKDGIKELLGPLTHAYDYGPTSHYRRFF